MPKTQLVLLEKSENWDFFYIFQTLCAFSFSPLGLPSILWHTLHFFSRWRSLFFASAMLETRLFSVLFFTLSTFTSILFQGEELSRRCRFPKGPSSKMNRRSTLFHLADNKTKGRKIFWSTKLLRGWVIFAHCDKETHKKMNINLSSR